LEITPEEQHYYRSAVMRMVRMLLVVAGVARAYQEMSLVVPQHL
jgi:hypothetical protein